MKVSDAKKATSAAAAKKTPFFGPAGEASVQHQPFFSTPTVQAKLNIGQKDDKFEKEADATAGKVVQKMTAPAIQKQPGECKEEDKLQKKEEEPVAIEEKVQRKPIFDSNGGPPDDDDPLQKKENGNHQQKGISSVESGLAATKGSGAPLSPGLNRSFGSAFGRDFSSVRIHHDAAAAKLSQDLNAQAFTHGNDIYFDSGKFDPGSNAGKHLLAHELTHTVQQGATDRISKSENIVQKNGATPAVDGPALDAVAKPGEGKIVKNGNVIEVRFTNFPVKQYSSVFVTVDKKGDEQLKMPPYKKPKGPRSTKQGAVWKKNALPDITASLQKVITAKNVQGPEYILEVSGNKKIRITGTVDQLAKEIVVPFWDYGGKPKKHEIEHKVDWQIAGGDANVDHISNLILLDSDSNRNIGGVIDKKIKELLQKILSHYKKSVPGITENFEEALEKYDIWFDNVTPDKEAVNDASIISISNIRASAGNNPINDKVLNIRQSNLEDGYFILKTSKSGAGNIVPYNLSNEHIEIKGDAKKKEVTSIKLKKPVKDNSNFMEKNPEEIPLAFTKEKQDQYKVNTQGYAGMLKDTLRIKYLSPVEFEEADFNPQTGWTAYGKIAKISVPLLDQVEVSFNIENSVFTLQASVTAKNLEGKLPKPFNIDYATLTLSASSNLEFKISGEAGFSIDKIGKGTIGASQSNKKGFALFGIFTFEKNKMFRKAEIKFDYAEKKWSASGFIEVEKGKITGVDTGSLTIKYEGDKLTGTGNAKLTVPGLDSVKLQAVFAESGFCIRGDVQLKKMKGVRDGSAQITIGRSDKGYSLGIKGTASPDIPAVPNLETKFTVVYEDGLFTITGNGEYKNPKLTGRVTLGVTNGTVNDKGEVQKGEGGATLRFFGKGSVTLTFIQSLKSTLDVFIDEKGAVLISGNLNFHSSPFDPLKKEKTLEVSQKIPVLGVPFVNVFVEIGAGLTLYLNWEPLIVDFDSTLVKTPLEDIKKGKLGGQSKLTLKSQAKAGVNMFVKLAAGVQVAIADVTFSLTGSAGVEAVADAGVEMNVDWDTEKGFKLKDGIATIDIKPKAVFALSGAIDVNLDILIDKVNIYHYPVGSVKKEVDISKIAFKSSLPVKFDENGQVRKPDESSLPKFARNDAETFMKQSIGMDKSDPPPSAEEQAKANIRQLVKRELLVRKNQSIDLYKYAADIRPKIASQVNEKAAPYVNEALEIEIKNIEAEDFAIFKNTILQANEPAAVKHAKIDNYKKGRALLDKSLIDDLHREVDLKAEHESKKPVQKKEDDAAVIQRQPDDAVPEPNVSVMEEPPDYTSWNYFQLREVYLQYNATPGVDDPERAIYEAVRNAMRDRAEETINACRSGKCRPGSDLGIADLYVLQNTLEDLQEKYFLLTDLELTSTTWELMVFEFQTAVAIRSKQNQQYRPQGMNTSRDYSTLDFIDVFLDLEEADNWLQHYAYAAERTEAKIYVRHLRNELQSKVASGLPLVLFTENISAEHPFIKNLDNSATLGYIYSIENILFARGELEKFTDRNKSAAISLHPMVFTLLDRQALYKTLLRNSLQVLHFHLYISGGVTDYRTLAEAGNRTDLAAPAEMPTDPVGIRHRLTEIWKNFYYYKTGPKIPAVTGLYAGDLIVKPLAQRIRAGEGPSGADPAWLADQVLFQWELIAEEEKNLLSGFSDTVKTQTTEILDASEKKIREQADLLGISIPEYLLNGNSPMMQAQNLAFAMNQQGNEIELAGIAEGAKQLAAIKKDIEKLNMELMMEDISFTSKVDEALAGFVASSDLLDAPESLRASAALYVSNKKEALQRKHQEKQNKELRFNLLRQQLEARHPLLASFASRGDSGDLEDLGEGGFATNRLAIADIIGKLRNIRKVKNELGDDISVWELHEIIPLAKAKMMITPLSFQDFVIDAKITKEREDKEFWETFKLVVGLGLTVLSFGSLSGPAAALVLAARIGSIGLDVYEAMEALEKYDIGTAMANTHFDQASSLSKNEPSLFGLALNIVAVVADVKDAAEIFNAASGLLKKTGLGAAEFSAEAKAIAKNLPDEAAAKKLVAEMEATRETQKIAAKVEKTVEDALENSATKIETEHGKLFVTKTGVVYKCSSPCTVLRSYFEKELAANPVLTARLNAIELALKAAGGKTNAQLRRQLKELSDVLVANRYFKVNVNTIIHHTDPLFRHDPPIGQFFIYRDAGGSMGMVKKIDADSVEIVTELGQRTVRKDFQNFVPSPGQLGLTDFERLHASGKIIGHESPFGIYYGPRWINHFIQKDGIEIALRKANIDPSNPAQISIFARKKTLPVRDRAQVIDNADFLDEITYKVGSSEVTLKVAEPNNPLSDLIIHVTSTNGSARYVARASDFTP